MMQEASIAELERAGKKAEKLGMGRQARDMEKKQDKLKAELETLKSDEGPDFADLGVDALFVDESQEFKNLGFATSMRVMGLGNPDGSKKAFDLFTKCRFIQKRHNGEGVYFMTGTPISNSLSELYTLQRYMDFDAMKKGGIDTFDAWASVFATIGEDLELDGTGVKYEVKSRMRSFNNVPELQAMYRAYADVVTQADLDAETEKAGLPRLVPGIEGGKPHAVICERSEDQGEYMDSLVERAENLKKVDPKDDNMLKITTQARKCALDQRLITPEAPDFEGSKTNVAAKNIYGIWRETEDVRGTQLVFCDLSTPKSRKAAEERGLDEIIASKGAGLVYHDLKNKLVEMGIPAHEIAFIHDADTDARKTKLYADMNAGRKRVLIGSTAKMGAGMNVQERLVAAHHLDAPWRPSDIEQRNGRIVRQGNVLFEKDPDFEVKIFNYATKGTYDGRMWQCIEYKSKIIDQFRRGDIQSRKIEDISMESVSAEEMKALASDNPLIKEEYRYKNLVRNLEADLSNFQRVQHQIRDQLAYYGKWRERLEKAETRWEQDKVARDAADQVFLIGGKAVKPGDLATGMKRLGKECQKQFGQKFPLGQYRGFGVYVAKSTGYRKAGFKLSLKGASGEFYEDYSLIWANDAEIRPAAVLKKLNAFIDDKMEERVVLARSAAKMEKNRADELRAGIVPWSKEKELKIARANLVALTRELKRMADDSFYRPDWKPFSIDDDVPEETVEIVENPFIRMIRDRRARLEDVPESQRTPEVCMEAVKIDREALEHVPDELLTPEVCMAAVQKDGYALKHVPDELRTPEIYLAAVKKNGRTLSYVPDALLTPEIYLAAVQNYGDALHSVPDELKTHEICMAAVSNDSYALQYVPDTLKTPELCMTAVSNHGKVLKHVPPELKTSELCMAAVSNYGEALEFVPAELQTTELIDAAVQQDKEAERYIYEECRTPDDAIVFQFRQDVESTLNRLNTLWIPSDSYWHDMQTPDIVMAAVIKNGLNLQYVTNSLKTPEVVEEAIRNNPDAAAYAPEEYAPPQMTM